MISFARTEIKNLRVAVARDHDVVWFKIAMDDSDACAFAKPLGDLVQEFEQKPSARSFPGEPSLAESRHRQTPSQ